MRFWISRNRRRIARRRRRAPVSAASRASYALHKEAARELVGERLALYSQHYRFPYGTVAIRNQKSRWGSCSTQGNLNFNYKIVFLPRGVADYIIVHELCHLKEFNHSPRFWALVAETIPDWRVRRAYLKRVKLSSLSPVSTPKYT